MKNCWMPGLFYLLKPRDRASESSLCLSLSLWLTLFLSLSCYLTVPPSLPLSLLHACSVSASLSHTHTQTECVCEREGGLCGKETILLSLVIYSKTQCRWILDLSTYLPVYQYLCRWFQNDCTSPALAYSKHFLSPEAGESVPARNPNQPWYETALPNKPGRVSPLLLPPSPGTIKGNRNRLRVLPECFRSVTCFQGEKKRRDVSVPHPEIGVMRKKRIFPQSFLQSDGWTSLFESVMCKWFIKYIYIHCFRYKIFYYANK